MRLVLALYGLAGLGGALCLVYALTDPTDKQPSSTDALAVVATVALWPVWAVVLVVGLSLDAVWYRRRVAYYGDDHALQPPRSSKSGS